MCYKGYALQKAYSEPSQRSKIVFFGKIFNGFQLLAILATKIRSFKTS